MTPLQRLEAASMNFKSATTMLDMLQFAGLLAMLILASVVFSRYYPGFRQRQERLELFDELCITHELSEEERLLLDELVEREALENRLLIFVQRSIFDRRIGQASGEQKRQLEALSKRLF